MVSEEAKPEKLGAITGWKGDKVKERALEVKSSECLLSMYWVKICNFLRY